ncbi:MAG: Asp-tRNA(Asn)/Glu-tRNA(Gln) amidotransferase subunit GatC [Deltaproteobacteria bacterium]|nr:Asp-tRNA(Asn)/Glu-tRNA(Gln) amidotransferase subunit GatC [Deltaproteobacteria bacterium]
MESQEKVLRVAKLARLDLGSGLSPEDAAAKLATFAKQFDDIVALMDTLAEVDTTGVEPLYWPLAVAAAPPRDDAAARHNTREELLRNAPEQDGRFFIVPKIV